jgi:hypothetical protein
MSKDRPFGHPAHIPPPFALAVHTIMHSGRGCYADGRVLAWGEISRVPVRQALGWVRDILTANGVGDEDLEEELAWWAEQLRPR